MSRRNQHHTPDEESLVHHHSDVSESRRGCSCKRCIVPFVIFAAFFLNFVASDVGTASDSLLTILTPPGWTFLVWLVIYVFQFIFVLYQLFAPKPRNSRLIQRQLPLLYIAHQVLTAIWLVMFSREKVYEATGIITGIWVFALLMFCLITLSFRTHAYRHYSTVDYFLIEVPFALLLGWETLATLISWNIFIVKLGLNGAISESTSQIVQVAAAISTLSIVAVAAILFAGLPMIMDPFVHLPIIWGLFGVGWRWTQFQPTELLPKQLSWADAATRQGVGYAAWFVGGIALIFCIVAGVILGSSRVCYSGGEESTETSRTSSGIEMRPGESHSIDA